MDNKKGSLGADSDNYALIAVNRNSKKVIEFSDFIMVGFTEEGEYVSNNCTIQQLAQGILRLQDLYDELVEEARIKNKPKLKILSK